MTWFKVDDKHHDHRKTRRALRGGQKRRDAAAIGLWCLAGSWSADNLMDGFVPTDELPRWDDDGEDLADRLVESDLWEAATRDGEPGFQFVNWDQHQPTKADVEAKREAARERMRAARSKGGKVSSREQTANVPANEQANFARSSRSVRSTPSRPVPSRPDQEASAVVADAPTRAELAIVDAELVADSGDLNAGQIIGEWIENCADRPPARVVGQVAKEVKALLSEGIDSDRVRVALAEWNRKGLHPSALASVVHEVGNKQSARPAKQQASDDMLKRAMARAEAREAQMRGESA